MKTPKLSFLVFALSMAGVIHCGDEVPPKTDAAKITMPGTGGSGGVGIDGRYDGSTAPDIALPSDTGIEPLDATMGGEANMTDGGGSSNNCLGMTVEQCHDSIINPAVVPASIQQLDPGPNAPSPYPNCSAI